MGVLVSKCLEIFLLFLLLFPVWFISGQRTRAISIVLNVLSLVLWPRMRSALVSVSGVLERKGASADARGALSADKAPVTDGRWLLLCPAGFPSGCPSRC